MTRESRLFLLLGAFALLLVLGACTSSEEEKSGHDTGDIAPTPALQGDVAQSAESPESGQQVAEKGICGGECIGPILAAIDAIDTAGLHGMSEDISLAATLSELGPVVGVLAAQDVIDSSGFHGMNEEIEAAGTMADISPRNLGKAEKALTALNAAPYPEALSEPADALRADLEKLIEGLSSGNLDQAKEGVHGVHSTQHDLSHEAFAWLGEQTAEEPGEGLVAAVGILAAQDVIDSSGFHGMNEEIEAAGTMADIGPSNLGKAEKALTALNAAPYPEALSEAVEILRTDLEKLIEGLSSGNLDQAKEGVHGVHSTQHDLSHEAFAWLGEQDGGTMLAGLLNPRWESKINDLLAVSESTPWYGDLSEAASAFNTDLEALADALGSGDLQEAAHTGHGTHASQHDLSHGVYEWVQTLSAETDRADLIMAAVDIVGSSGFHGMSEEIDAATSMSEVSPRNLSKVQKAIAAAKVVDWPEPMAENASAFLADAQALADGLDSGDLAAAKEASHGVHSSQHDLAHSVYKWLGGNASSAVGVGAIVKAVDIANTTGFHGMSHEIEHAGTMADINPRYAGKVKNAWIMAQAVAWPDDLAEATRAYIRDVGALSNSLESGDLPGAKAAVSAVHSSQHDFSHEVHHWLGEGHADAAAMSSADSPGDSDHSTEDGHGHERGEYANAPVVELEVADWKWIRRTVTLKKGEPVVLRITNSGEMPHGIWIPELGVNVPTPPGEITVVPLTPRESGEFFLGCNNPMCGTGEQHAGMIAQVIVEE